MGSVAVRASGEAQWRCSLSRGNCPFCIDSAEKLLEKVRVTECLNGRRVQGFLRARCLLEASIQEAL